MKPTKLLALSLFVASAFAQSPVAKPPITGAAHMAYYVTDLAKARAYYKDFLGFEEAFTLKNPDGSDHIAFIKINDHQFIELLLEPPRITASCTTLASRPVMQPACGLPSLLWA